MCTSKLIQCKAIALKPPKKIIRLRRKCTWLVRALQATMDPEFLKIGLQQIGAMTNSIDESLEWQADTFNHLEAELDKRAQDIPGILKDLELVAIVVDSVDVQMHCGNGDTGDKMEYDSAQLLPFSEEVVSGVAWRNIGADCIESSNVHDVASLSWKLAIVESCVSRINVARDSQLSSHL